MGDCQTIAAGIPDRPVWNPTGRRRLAPCRARAQASPRRNGGSHLRLSFCRIRGAMLRLDLEDPPRSREAFELVLASVEEDLIGADDQVPHSAANQHLARA